MKDRYAPRMAVQCPIIFQSETGVGQGTALNLSLPGAAVEIQKPVPIGRHLRLNVFLPDGQPSLKVILATVRWVQGLRFGVEFLRLSETAEERLTCFLTTPTHDSGGPPP